MKVYDKSIDINTLKKSYREVWWNMPMQLNIPIKEVSYLKKKSNERSFERLIDEIISVIKSFPASEEERPYWKKESKNNLYKIVSTMSELDINIINEIKSEAFVKTTREFIKKCKEFDKNISYGDIGQAMRNIWIINILQEVFGRNVEFNMASFGYSMLYPYSDNYLDDFNVDKNEKLKFNERFYKRLIGEDIKAKSKLEEQVFDLIKKIEDVYDRSKYPKVFESLLIIFEGQRKSITQQGGLSNPYEIDMLDISIEKGGASVLADGYLIDGELSKDEEEFCYGYGFILQLCDDLQDVREDLNNKHMTVMSQLATKYDLDNVVTKAINLVIYLINEEKCFKCEKAESIKQIIMYNCILMILFAIIMAKEYFSKEYIKQISKYVPFTIDYMEKIKGRLEYKFNKIEKSYHGIYIEDILFYLFM